MGIFGETALTQTDMPVKKKLAARIRSRGLFLKGNHFMGLVGAPLGAPQIK